MEKNEKCYANNIGDVCIRKARGIEQTKGRDENIRYL